MTRRHRSPGATARPAVCLLAVVATLVTVGAAHASENSAAGADGTAVDRELEASTLAAGQPRQPDRDFLFGRPRWSVGMSAGWLFASQTGGIFDFTRELLTVNAGDFDMPTARFSVGRSLTERLDLLFEAGVSSATIVSEYRDFVDDAGLPIGQQTELKQVPLGGSVRYWLVPRGREVSRLAWVPARLAPYVGGGGGWQWYRFTQIGEFVDIVDLSIFRAGLESSGWTVTGHVFGGAGVKLHRRLFADIEARYGWASTPLTGDFIGFDNIDLNGLQITGGIELVF